MSQQSVSYNTAQYVVYDVMTPQAAAAAATSNVHTDSSGIRIYDVSVAAAAIQ